MARILVFSSMKPASTVLVPLVYQFGPSRFLYSYCSKEDGDVPTTSPFSFKRGQVIFTHVHRRVEFLFRQFVEDIIRTQGSLSPTPMPISLVRKLLSSIQSRDNSSHISWRAFRIFHHTRDFPATT